MADQEEMAVTVLPHVVDLHDIGVGQVAKLAGFPQHGAVEVGVGKLDRTGLAGDPVAAEVDVGEPPRTEIVQDAITLARIDVGAAVHRVSR